MALAPLATVDDLEALGVTVGSGDVADVLLDSVSSAVRDAAGSVIAPPVTSTVTLPGAADAWLTLPLAPVTSVSAVEIDGESVTDYRHVGSRLWRARGWLNGCEPAVVEVTCTHGLPEVPADIKKLVCTLVAAGLIESAEGLGANRGVSGEGVDDYRISFTRGEDEVVDKTDLPERTRRMLARRFGSGVHVARSL